VGEVCEGTPLTEIISSVKFGGVNMTPVPGSAKSRGSSSSTLRADLYYMLNPPVGTYTVLITYNGSVSYRAGGAISLKNVNQAAPETVVTNSKSSVSTISTDITVPNNGAWIVDVVGHSSSGSFTTSTTSERWDKNSGYHTIAGGTKAVTTPGSNTITWNYSGGSGTMVHSLAAFAPSETVLVPPARTLTVSTTTGGIVTTPGIGNFNYPDGNIVNLVASANANYHFANWTGSGVTAGKVSNPNAAGTTITMDSDYTVTANFAINQMTISGYITELDANIPVEGVFINANNGGGSDTTDPNGYYEVWVSYNWSGTVTPTDEEYTFEPANRPYSNVLADQTYQGYVGTSIYDLYPDGIIDLLDLDVFCENWLTTGPGDFDNDGTVDFRDFAEFASVW